MHQSKEIGKFHLVSAPWRKSGLVTLGISANWELMNMLVWRLFKCAASTLFAHIIKVV